MRTCASLAANTQVWWSAVLNLAPLVCVTSQPCASSCCTLASFPARAAKKRTSPAHASSAWSFHDPSLHYATPSRPKNTIANNVNADDSLSLVAPHVMGKVTMR